MVKKSLVIPLKLAKDEALLRSILPEHAKRGDIARNVKKGRAGYRGELELKYHLEFLPESDYSIFYDLRFPFLNRYFQLDTFILCSSFGVIIESKNFYGHLYFDAVSKQLFRTFDGERETFPDPLIQVQRQEKRFQAWLKNFMNKPIPTYHLVSIGSPHTIVETSPGNEKIFNNILHAEHIPNKILELSRNHADEKLTSYQLRKMEEHLLREHIPPHIDILSSYGIHPTELLTGVPCHHCSVRGMHRIHGKWYCDECKSMDSQAHEQVIKDYLQIHGRVTNKDCRELLGISSIHTATRLLNSMNLRTVGDTKGRVYTLN